MSYLAFDLGAESGRLMLGRLSAGRKELSEVLRFLNRMVNTGGSLHSDGVGRRESSSVDEGRYVHFDPKTR